MNDEEELALTEQEWEALTPPRPAEKDDPPEELAEPWAREEGHAHGWHGWERLKDWLGMDDDEEEGSSGAQA
jgi:hypothetical protein